MIVAIDIETKPALGFESYEKAALDHHRNEITQIAWACSDGTAGVFSGLEPVLKINQKLSIWRENKPQFVGHNLKFDLKTLITKGAHLTVDDYGGDTMLQAVASFDKIPEDWLSHYEVKRQEENAKYKKQVHREAGQYSLKTLAPFHLGIAPFWETESHDNAEYALNDARYTLQLYLKQQEILMAQGTHDFYDKKIMGWARMILEAELRGVKLDLDLLERLDAESKIKAAEARNELIELWQEPMEEYGKLQYRQIDAQYEEMKARAINKAKTEKTKLSAVVRYDNLKQRAIEKIEPFNMDSPSQLMWLFRDYYGLDVNTFEGDESTGKSVLNRLASEGRQDVGKFLEYRKHTKLTKAFFPAYKSMHWDGRIYCGFNLNGTRTGRLSSSEPNLQQVPGELHSLFIAERDRRLLCYDLSNIEPILIAYITECPNLCKLLIDGRNFHDVNTKVFFDLPDSIPDSEIKKTYARERKVAKELGLLLLYGGGKKKIRESAQKYGFQFSMADCEQKYNRFRKQYDAVFQFKKQLDKRLEAGEAIKNLMGRHYKIPNRDDVYMKGLNTLIQSSASDLLVESAARAYRRYKAENIDAVPILFVHDETIVDASEADAERARDVLLQEMLSYNLTTPYGQIKLKAEGGINGYWQK
jgi:DNA polymerase I-like protein with 3'-5' exonuclease and polymerase domains